MQAEKLTSFIARGDHNGIEIKNFQMIIDATGKYKFNDATVTGNILGQVNDTGFSKTNPNTIFVNDPKVSAGPLKEVTKDNLPVIAGIAATPGAASSEAIDETPVVVRDVRGEGIDTRSLPPADEITGAAIRGDSDPLATPSEGSPNPEAGGARKRSYKQKTQKRRQKKQQRRKSRRV